MRRGNQPGIVFDQTGALFAIATGSDACAEHECGAATLLTELTGNDTPYARDLGRLLRTDPTLPIPDLAQSLRVTAGLEDIVFDIQRTGEEPEAILAYSARLGSEFKPFEHQSFLQELAFNGFSEPKDMIGAWGDSGFAFRVRGQFLVDKLSAFADAMKAGDVMFAGRLFEEPRLTGVIFARTDRTQPSHLENLRQAQEKFEADVELHRRSRADELNRLASQAKAFSYFHAWPVWAERKPYGDVMYCVNPGRDFNMPYGTKGSFEELSAWLSAGAKEPFRATT